MAGREGQDLGAEAHQVLRLAGEGDGAVGEEAVIQGTDADGIAGGNQAVLFAVIQDHSKLRIQHPKHVEPVFLVQGQKQLAVGIADEGIAFADQFVFLISPAVKLAIADDLVLPPGKRLHSAHVEPHDGKTVEAEEPVPGLLDPGIIRSARFGPVKIRTDRLG